VTPFSAAAVFSLALPEHPSLPKHPSQAREHISSTGSEETIFVPDEA
jgi:hypothetical protein